MICSYRAPTGRKGDYGTRPLSYINVAAPIRPRATENAGLPGRSDGGCATADEGSSSMTKLEKSLVGLAGEYAVASELCRRGVYAQLTLGNRKKVDLLLDGEQAIARVEVKTKQGREWPGVKGIAPGDGLKFLVLVDLQGKERGERPEFYVISRDEWRPFLEQKLQDRRKQGLVEIGDDNVARHRDGFVGTGIKAEEVAQFRNDWDKIVRVVGPTTG